MRLLAPDLPSDGWRGVLLSLARRTESLVAAFISRHYLLLPRLGNLRGQNTLQNASNCST